MLCCFTGSKEGQLKQQTLDKKTQSATLKNRRPEDFMKEEVHLSLSPTIRFSLARNLTWLSELSDGKRSDDKRSDDKRSSRQDPAALQLKAEKNELQLRQARQERRALQERMAQLEAEEKELTVKLLRSGVDCLSLEYLIEDKHLAIHAFFEKSKQLV